MNDDTIGNRRCDSNLRPTCGSVEQYLAIGALTGDVLVQEKCVWEPGGCSKTRCPYYNGGVKTVYKVTV